MKNYTLLFALVAIAHTLFAQNMDSAKIYYQKGIDEKEAKHFLAAAGYLI
jgi:hypothetical protein